MQRYRPSLHWLLATGYWLFFCGCGGDGIDRLAVSGSVTLGGEPLAEGSISFLPLEGGPAAGGSIESGLFEIDREKGPAPKRYRVEISSYQPTGKQVSDPDFPGKTKAERAQVVPPRYNRQSELSVDLSSQDPDGLRFELTR